MRVLITGICGFVGSQLARRFAEAWAGSGHAIEIIGIDNLIRPGSERNRSLLSDQGIAITHGDIRAASDIDSLPPVDWVIDAAANPSVLAGIDGKTSSRQIIEHNLVGTINLLEYCKRHQAGFILPSTSRVYSIGHLCDLPIVEREDAFALDEAAALPVGVSSAGVSEDFPTEAPISLYGASKLASGTLALEYGSTFDFPVWINRCGVLAGAGQFGKPDQGIFAYWIHSFAQRQPLKYIGFRGTGFQVRDCLHPRDLADLLLLQIQSNASTSERVFNVGGGAGRQMSLRQLSAWCARRFGAHSIESSSEVRRFDIPWVVMDSSRACEAWSWEPQTSLEVILDEIAEHAVANADWLRLSAA